MFGTIIGTIVGSSHEFDWNSSKRKHFSLPEYNTRFTGSSVMALAVAQALMAAPDPSDDEGLNACFVQAMQELGRAYPHAGYGRLFSGWLVSDAPRPYGSYGNGAAVRVSPVAWFFDSLEEVRRAARLSAAVTHDHPESIRAAEAAASAVFLARKGSSKAEIRRLLCEEFGYDLSRSCDALRAESVYVTSSKDSVPPAFQAFLEGGSFEDVIRTAISLGGSSEAQAAIAGSIAEAYYGIDEDWKKLVNQYLPDDLLGILRRFDLRYGASPRPSLNPLHEAILFAEEAHRGQTRKGTDIAYITHPMEVFQILSSMNANQDLLIAGLLHDTVEDTAVSLGDIRRAFGDRVAFLVGSHSEDKEKSWQERKQHTIDTLKTAEYDVRLLILADRVSNLRSMFSDYVRLGDALWERFNAPKELQAWYSSEVDDALCDLGNDPNARLIYWELNSLFKELFVDFYADPDKHRIYQIPCGLPGYVFCAEDGSACPYEGPAPEGTILLPRQKAEELEDYWRQHYRDHTLDPFGMVRDAILTCSEDPSDRNKYAVIEQIREMRLRNRRLIFPVAPLPSDLEAEASADTIAVQTLELADGRVCAVACTDYEALRRGPETDSVPAHLDSILETVYQSEWLDGLLINPWNGGFLLSKAMIRAILDGENEPEAYDERVSFINVREGDLSEAGGDCLVSSAYGSFPGFARERVLRPDPALRLPSLDCIHPLEVGEAAISGSHNLPVKYVIHTRPPIYTGSPEDAARLAACYRSCLDLAKQQGIHNITFPSIGTGIYGYGVEEASRIAVHTVQSWLEENAGYPLRVRFDCHDTYSCYAYQKRCDEYGKEVD